MFLYFNHQGELTTSIPHGEIPRQGNPLSVYVAVDKAFFKNKNPNTPLGWALKVAVVSETEMAESFPMTYLGLEIFKKKNGSEITYDLVENTPYHMYYQKIPAEYSTAEFGDKRLIVSFYRKQLLNDGTFSDSVVEYYNNEACDLHIEKTYGNASVPITISKNQYKIIQEKLNNLTVSKQDKNLFNGTTVKNLSKAFDYFCSGNSTIVCYNEYLMQVISVDAHDDERYIYGLFNDTIFKFNFNVNDPIDLLIHPEKVDISEGLSSSIGIFPIDGILSESEIKELYNTKENGK